jgi:hypothetical protein
MVFLDKERMMDNVQKHNFCTNDYRQPQAEDKLHFQNCFGCDFKVVQ